MPRPVRTAVAIAAVALVLGACTGSGDEPTPTPTPTPTAEPVVAPVVRTVRINGAEVPLEVGPLAVHDDVAVLRLAAPTDPPTLRMAFWEVFESIGSPGPSGVRLVDADAGTVLPTARDDDDGPVMSRNFSPEGPATAAAQEAAGDDEIVYAAFAVPDGSTVDVLLPSAGWFDDVPVVDADTAGTWTVPPSELVEGEITGLPVLPLEQYIEQVDGQVRARTTPTEVTVAVASDVLFAVDSADLGPDAEAALAAAGVQVAGYASGRLTIVGHTDDVADEAYNLDLSQRRAASVAQRLGDLVDLAGFEVSVEGRGESEPAVPEKTDEARSLNRRVEITLAPPPGGEVAPVAPTDDAELPATTGPTGSGPDGVTVQDGQNTYSVRLPEVRRSGAYLVGELELTNLASINLQGDVLATGAWDTRGDFDASLQQAATNVTVLVGHSRFYPVDYLRTVDPERREPLTDRSLLLSPGATGVVTVVWPDPGTSSVAVEVASRHLSAFGGLDVGGAAFRLTDVPVVDAP